MLEEYRIPPDLIRFLDSFDQISRSLAPVLQAARRALDIVGEHKAEERLAAPFTAHGLCMAPSMRPELREMIVQRYAASSSTVPQLVLGYYRRDRWARLREMVAAWDANRFYAPRFPIIRDALWAHTNRRYSLSVIALTYQVEGLVWDWLFAWLGKNAVAPFVTLKKRARGARRNGATAKYSGNILSETVGDIRADALTRDQWASMKTLVEFANNHLFRPYRIEAEHDVYLRSRHLARHAIAHGSGLGSGTALNSLRLFLALDVLALVPK